MDELHYYQVKNQLDLYTCEEIQAYLKERYNLGVFNLSLPFHYIPKNEDSEAGSD